MHNFTDDAPIGCVDLLGRWTLTLCRVLYARFGTRQFTPDEAWAVVEAKAPKLARELRAHVFQLRVPDLLRYSMAECLVHTFLWLHREQYACGTVAEHYVLIDDWLRPHEMRKR